MLPVGNTLYSPASYTAVVSTSGSSSAATSSQLSATGASMGGLQGLIKKNIESTFNLFNTRSWIA